MKTFCTYSEYKNIEQKNSVFRPIVKVFLSLYTAKPASTAKFPNPTSTAPKKATKKNAIPIQRENIKIENPERFYEFDDEIGRFVCS